jgi:hypothetical protein
MKANEFKKIIDRVVECEDCGKQIKFPRKPVIKGICSKKGVYYEGKGICWECAGIRKEKFNHD